MNTWPLFVFPFWCFIAKSTLSLVGLHSERRSTVADHRFLVFSVVHVSEDAGVFFARLSQCIPIHIVRGLDIQWIRRLGLLMAPNLKFLFLSQFSLLLEIHFFEKSFYYLIRKFPVFNCGNLFAE